MRIVLTRLPSPSSRPAASSSSTSELRLLGDRRLETRDLAVPEGETVAAAGRL
jgi:hypothetical protein